MDCYWQLPEPELPGQDTLQHVMQSINGPEQERDPTKPPQLLQTHEQVFVPDCVPVPVPAPVPVPTLVLVGPPSGVVVLLH